MDQTALPDFLVEYLKLLREEILQAQQARRALVAAKLASLASLYAYALGKNQGPSIADEYLSFILLLGPPLALGFDCMIYGLTFNIQELGAYIGRHIEPQFPRPKGTFKYWQESLKAARGAPNEKKSDGNRNWTQKWDFGRSLSRYGSYSITTIACFTSFKLSWDAVDPWWRNGILGLVAVFLSVLLYFEANVNKLADRRHEPDQERREKQGDVPKKQ